jgi:hypothetical protein
MSTYCERRRGRGPRHVACPHWYAGGPFHGSPGLYLCECSCHNACPLADRVRATTAEWMASCDCPGSEPEKARRRRHSKVVRIDIPEHFEATGAQLETDGNGDGYFFRFTARGHSWTPQYISYDEHLGPDMTLRDTAEWIERVMKGSGYRVRRVKSGDKTVAAWAVTFGSNSE